MDKTFFFLNLFSFICTIISLSLAITYESDMSSLYKETPLDDTLQFEFLYGVLCHPSTVLQIVIIIFDVCYYAVYFIGQSRLIQGTEEEKKMRPAQLQQDNRINNILMDFAFFFLIKGLSLGFSCFYAYESIIEINRLLSFGFLKPKQSELLQSMLNLNVAIKWFLITLMIYIAWLYIIRVIQVIVKNKRNGEVKKDPENYDKIH